MCVNTGKISIKFDIETNVFHMQKEEYERRACVKKCTQILCSSITNGSNIIIRWNNVAVNETKKKNNNTNSDIYKWIKKSGNKRNDHDVGSFSNMDACMCFYCHCYSCCWYFCGVVVVVVQLNESSSFSVSSLFSLYFFPSLFLCFPFLWCLSILWQKEFISSVSIPAYTTIYVFIFTWDCAWNSIEKNDYKWHKAVDRPRSKSKRRE